MWSPVAAQSQRPRRLTPGTKVCEAVLALLCVDQVVPALLGGCSLQHCFKQGGTGLHEGAPAGQVSFS